MSKRKDGLKPGEVARTKRVARAIANAMRELPPSRRRILAVRNVVGRLKEHHLRPRDLDSPNAEDAVAAIISTIPVHALQMTVPPLGKIWEMTASRAIQYLGAGMS